ncbi:restriction endonuclease subunit S [Pseudomonas sp. CFBP 13711]|uniref:restriction endonuclease subunit S n=1 Tax=unclassified Pseudomonas TaxID=196821 RepID=UPI00177EB0AE|nr:MULTISPECIES: restriction endonuclease subunit S [unclassified Pseudomonas]MBD8707522.1 restriction endonuclease subunit S [Pseudomonas sp. CFBP 13711]MBD8713180.1 restriction endonuclease subunit S [Pseudomonas sp. CFBP 13715]
MSELQTPERRSFPSTWQALTLADISEKITDGSHQSPRPQSVGKFMCSVKDMTYDRFDLSGSKLISVDDYELLVRQGCQPKKGDILISKDGANCLDLIFVYDQDEELVLLSSIAIVRLLPGYIPKYVSYFLLSPDCQYVMRNNYVSGSAIPRVVLKDFRKVPILVPPPAEQASIASTLSSFDDKINLLQRQNKTLEAMSEALFRHRCLESISDSWEERPLSSIARFLNGLACQKYPPGNDLEKLPVLKIRELSSGISENSDWATDQVKPDYIVEAGDVIFAWSASLMVKIWDGERCVLNQHLFKVTSDEFPKWFYLLWCKHHLAEFISISSSHATTMGHIKRSDLDAAIVLIPTAGELKELSKQMEPLLDKQIANAKQIKSLEKLRDTLLPKLMSGEARVSF